ncbi:MAG: response regulator [Desulfomonile tiedjei]|uniref:Response regulator n=1 Tax=Desulfomonile tiedjei TaxID=2358 RepID=A0A9D6V1K8_9BACT|nr:response regulator [Desulfomonile tiedjei]
MPPELLKGRQILAVDDEKDVLDVLEEELQDYGVRIERVYSYEEAIAQMSSLTYDLVILDIMGVSGFELLEYAAAKKIPVVMLTAHALSSQYLKKSVELGARAYLPKDQLGQIAPFLEETMALSYQSGWKSLFSKLGAHFGTRFGPEWRKTEKEFWERFEKDLEVSESNIIQP